MQKKKRMSRYLAHVPNETKKKEGNGLRCFMINGRDTTGNYLIKVGNVYSVHLHITCGLQYLLRRKNQTES